MSKEDGTCDECKYYNTSMSKDPCKSCCRRGRSDNFEPIEDGPVSAEESVRDWLMSFPHTIENCTVYSIHFDDLERLVKLCEQNDRKLTQPVIDEVAEVARNAIKQLDAEGYDATAAEFDNDLSQALKKLEEHDNEN